MPELPEVETTRRGIAPHIDQQTIRECRIHFPTLRWPIPQDLAHRLAGHTIETVQRRGKYLLLEVAEGWVIIHLGMSGSLRVLDKQTPLIKHDHFEIEFENGLCLRLNDPRRFGAVLWQEKSDGDIQQHSLLRKLAPEPHNETFNHDWLFNALKRRKSPIKTVIMNSEVVVGAGNIYANESLFRSRIHPLTPANQLSPAQAEMLCANIKAVLAEAIAQGGTTLKDFIKPDGKPGYFAQNLDVYGRDQLPCHQCSHPIEKVIIAQRASFYCPQCQPKTPTPD